MIKIVSNARMMAKKIRYFIMKSPQSTVSVLEETAFRIRDRMNVRKPKTDYPVTWDSERQRRAFFATNGFGKGIPYKRTGDTAWTVTQPFANEIDIFAPHPAGAVFGMPTANFWQSAIHRETWPYLKVVLTEEISKIPKSIVAGLKILFNEQQT